MLGTGFGAVTLPWVEEVLTWIEKHPGLASWTQAVVGLATIMAALGIALLEGHRANKATNEAFAREDARQARQEAREVERLSTLRYSAVALLSLAEYRVRVAGNLIKKNTRSGLTGMCRTHQRDLASMETQLAAIPAFDLADMGLADIMAQAQVAVRSGRVFLEEQVVELQKSYEGRHDRVATTLHEIARHLKEMKNLFEKRLDELRFAAEHA
jgi:hypothetical protein